VLFRSGEKEEEERRGSEKGRNSVEN